MRLGYSVSISSGSRRASKASNLQANFSLSCRFLHKLCPLWEILDPPLSVAFFDWWIRGVYGGGGESMIFRREVPTLKGVVTFYLAKFSLKQHENG